MVASDKSATNGKKKTLQPLRLQGFVDKVIISWRTEVRDVQPSDRTSNAWKPESLVAQWFTDSRFPNSRFYGHFVYYCVTFLYLISSL